MHTLNEVLCIGDVMVFGLELPGPESNAEPFYSKAGSLPMHNDLSLRCASRLMGIPTVRWNHAHLTTKHIAVRKSGVKRCLSACKHAVDSDVEPRVKNDAANPQIMKIIS